ncbi:ABC transporter permease [Clostridium sp. DJ247]|uniref:ABC transporter permease n=1 Tax=Clostridium sp. DJ247 TaxID=2726188 RepID=UPI0016257C4D|nr:ABC transporter permease [Clostridium sp. DJ247]MBC2579760.1 ABC transporter permease [Clostridium sp. DJ247]
MKEDVLKEERQSDVAIKGNSAVLKGKKKKKFHKSKFVQAFSLVLFFITWQIISMLNENFQWFNPLFLPSPISVCETTIGYIKDGTLLPQLFVSVVRALLGFILGTIVATVLGILICRSKLLDDLINPIFNLIGPIPVYAFLPIFIIWFGIGEISKISLIAYATFMPQLTYTVDGIRGVNPKWIRSAMSLGANEHQIFRKIILKAALPNIFVGMRVSLALTFSALVVAEMMGASAGLGFIIVNARNWFKMGDMFMAVTLIGLLYTLFNYALTVAERILFKWKKDGLQGAVEQ